MSPTARIFAATALGLASGSAEPLTVNSQQFTVTAEFMSYCMVSTGSAGVELSKLWPGEIDTYGDVLTVCSKGPSISSVGVEGAGPWATAYQYPSVRLASLRIVGAYASGGAARLSTEFSAEPPVAWRASLHDRPFAATGEVSRKVRVTVTYD
jgi:hypothetical protein